MKSMPTAILHVPLHNLFPPKELMEEFMENRGRQDETGRRQVLQVFPDRQTQPIYQTPR